jgi:hypothetical protein
VDGLSQRHPRVALRLRVLSGEFRKCRARSHAAVASVASGWSGGLTQTSFEVLAGEAPGERLTKGGVASGEGVKGVGQFLNAGVVIWFEHVALDNRKVKFRFD